MEFDQNLKKILKKEAEDYFRDVYNECQVNASKKVYELEIIKMMHKKFKSLSDSWYKSSGNKVYITSFFTHSNPVVSEIKKDISGSKTIEPGCEAGDILYLHVEMGLSGPPSINSMLYQAKVTDTEYNKYERQEELYSNWPTFIFSSPKYDQEFNVVSSSPSPHDGARFLEINTHIKTNPSYDPNLRYQSYLPNSLVNKVSFIDQMIEVLEFTSGRQLNKTIATASNEDKDWHDAIDFIMDYAHHKTYAKVNRQNGPGKNPPNGTSALYLSKTNCCHEFSNYWLSNQDTTFRIPVHENSDTNNNGILVILSMKSDYPIELIERE